MDELGLGAALRAVRVRRGLRQDDVATRAGTSRTSISRIERGGAAEMPFATIRSLAAAYGVRVELTARWRGGELDRLLSARHALMHDSVARWLGRFHGWEFAPEATYAFGGERGVVDVLGWHRSSRTLLILELKTQVVDVNDLMATMDRRRRLASMMARERGWLEPGTSPAAVISWVLVADASTNRRRVASHDAVLARAFPARGRTLGASLRDPAAVSADAGRAGRPFVRLDGLSFLSDVHVANARRRIGPSGAVRARPRGASPS